MTKRAFLIFPALLSPPATAEPGSTDISDYIGPNPKLVAPSKTTFPTVNVAEAKGWPAGKMPTPAEGLAVNEFAGGLTIRGGCWSCQTAMSWSRKPTIPGPTRPAGPSGARSRRC